MTVLYEWDVESWDEDEDDCQHNHSDTCPGLTADPLDRLVLVRDVFDDDNLIDRSWAYVTDGKLPERFHQIGYDEETEETYERPCERVPKRFHAELAKTIQKASK